MRLLFVTLTGQGHITPTLPLVTELVRRGHQVEYATEEPVGAGSTHVQLPKMQPDFPVGDNILAAWLKHFFTSLSRTYPILLDHCTNRRPDAIIYDTTNWPARLVAEKLGIPAVRTVPHFAANDAFPLHETMITGLDTTEIEAMCDRFSAEHGVPLDFAGTWEVPQRLNLVFLPRDFQPAVDSFDDRFRFIGPLLGDRAQEEWAPRGKPLLYISLGSVFTDIAFYRRCIEMFGDTDWHVAMTVGDAELGAVPSNFDIRPRFPQVAVLKQASAFVTHGGMNSVMEALSHAVPLVVVPMTPEQKSNADRVVEMGLGAQRGNDLKAAVAKVSTDPDVRANLDRMRAVIAKSGGAVRGADEIESYLKTPGHPS
ncbi:glycosyl transferase [Kibdelosporangium philippinense]|uniref:Glycosyl transferase n=1 Tax=Kibdelosporangium philippinense TaxID=211113 RepID=A0ABS8Z475_9PSEU|nr:macrolide family glycosyltransferase [Kibdelosporangium philippinense]MCE7001585.1 glycosyl transferase [Kibdelosporangium philippinense]